MRPRDRLAQLFAIDVRSLAAFRIGLAALLIADLLKRALTLEAHYSDAGVLPRAVASELLAPAPWFARFHFISGDVAFQAFVFAVAALAALALLAGYRTRLAALLSYALLLSVQFRNPLVNHTGDAYLQCLLLWALFLPLGATWSIDARRAGSAPRITRVCSPASAALLLQITLFYLFAGVLKHEQAIWREGQALALFLHEDAYTRPLVRWLLPHTELLRFGTWAALFLEGVAPLLFFSPWQTARIRTLLVLVFTGFHLSIQLCVYIGIFEFTSIVGLLVFVPACVWDELRRRRKADPRTTSPKRTKRWREPRWSQAIVVAFGIYVFVSNLGSLGLATPDWPGPVRELARQLRLNQRWAIFTQLDQLDAGWFSVVLEGTDGERYEARSGTRLANERDILAEPEGFAASYSNHNERRYWRHIRKQRFAAFRPALARYYCRRPLQAAPPNSHPHAVRIYQVIRRVDAALVVGEPQARQLIAHACAAADEAGSPHEGDRMARAAGISSESH